MEGGREYISERISRGNDVRSELVTYVELEMLDLEEKGVGKGHLGLVFTFKLCQFLSNIFVDDQQAIERQRTGSRFCHCLSHIHIDEV